MTKHDLHCFPSELNPEQRLICILHMTYCATHAFVLDFNKTISGQCIFRPTDGVLSIIHWDGKKGKRRFVFLLKYLFNFNI